MVKESGRKKAYHPRGPHKEGCGCVTCVAKRVKAAPTSAQPPVGFITTHVTYHEPPPQPVRLDSLLSTDNFEYRGENYRVGGMAEGLVGCYNLTTSTMESLGGATLVIPR